MPGRDHPHMLTMGIPSGTAGGAEAIGAAVRRVAEPILASLGLVLVAVEVQGHGPKSSVRVVIERTPTEGDAAGGVSIEDCGRVHVLLGHALDVDDPIPHTYVLEISSPGLDRPIRQVGDYERFRGCLARFKLVKPFLGQSVLIGRIHQLEGEQVWVEAKGGSRQGRGPAKMVALPLAEIAEARLEVEF